MNRKVSHYQILEHLATGGMGEVYKAEDTRLRRVVALKILPPALLEDEQARQRLTDEAQRAASLNHPNIATIYELGQQDGLSFIAMEYVEGERLAETIKREPLDISRAIEIAIDVAEALGAAHKRGVVNCDIKSGNIMMTGDGVVKVLDFGLARSRVEQAASLLASNDGTTSGTVSYMSPEQLRGEPLDERTDIFSLGVVL